MVLLFGSRSGSPLPGCFGRLSMAFIHLLTIHCHPELVEGHHSLAHHSLLKSDGHEMLFMLPQMTLISQIYLVAAEMLRQAQHDSAIGTLLN